MRILYISGEPFPDGGAGGVHVTEAAAHLAARGHELALVGSRVGGRPGRERWRGMDVRRARMTWFGKTWPLLGLFQAWRLGRPRPDVIMERYVTFGGAGAILARLWRRPLVLEINSPHVEELFIRLGIKNRLLKWALRRWVDFQFRTAAAAVAPIRGLAPAHAEHKVTRVAWAANAELFTPARRGDPRTAALREELRLPAGKTVIFTGSFRAWHGVRRMPDIIEETRRREPEVVFLLVGDGDCWAEVKAETERRGLTDRVRLTGRRPYEETPLYCAAADVGVAPYDASAYPALERFGFYWSPLKLFEYMASGLPAVASDYPELAELLGRGERGVLTRPGDPAAAAEAIAALLRDPARREAMGRAGRRFIEEKGNWAAHAEQLEGVLRGAVAGAAGDAACE